MSDNDILDDEQTVILTLSEAEAQLIQRALSDARTGLANFMTETKLLGAISQPMIEVAQGEVEVIDDLLMRIVEE